MISYFMERIDTLFDLLLKVYVDDQTIHNT